MSNFGLPPIYEFYGLKRNQSIIPDLPKGKSEIFEDDLGDLISSFNPEIKHYSDIIIKDFEIHSRPKPQKDIAKLLLKERITGKSFADASGSEPYLESNAQTRGDEDLLFKINLKNQCQKSVVWFVGETSGDNYIKTIDCRKQWCPICGGKGGKIHDSRLHAIFSRFDVGKYNLRQFVFTVPESLREILLKKENLNLLHQYAKEVIEKYFGVPQFDKKGHIKRYKLEKGVISYLHLFGDKQPGVYKPHLNFHILEDKKEKLFLDKSILDAIKKSWLKKLKKFDQSLTVVDVEYEFKITKGKVIHALKYMSRPWSAEHFEAIENENLKKFVVLDLSGFQYLRFMGSLANCNYKDDMILEEEKENCESQIDEKLITVGMCNFSIDSWKDRLIKIDEGFYRVKGKRPNEPENSEAEKEKRNVIFQ